MNPLNETTVEERQLLDRQKINNRVGLDRDASLAEPTDIAWNLSAVIASAEGQAAGYSMGWTHGYTEGYRAAQEDAAERRVRAQIARAGVEAIDTVRARRKADDRARHIATEHRRSA